MNRPDLHPFHPDMPSEGWGLDPWQGQAPVDDARRSRFFPASDLDRQKASHTARGGRQVVHYVESELPNVVNAACQAAVDAGAQLYARGTSLFRPVTIEHGTITGGVRRKEGATMLVPVDKPALVELLTALMDWRRYDARRRVDDPWKPIS